MNQLDTAKILAAALKLAESQTKKEVQKLREELDLRESTFAEKLDRIRRPRIYWTNWFTRRSG